MIKLGGLPLTKSRIAASFWRPIEQMRLAQLREQGLEIAEIRLDMAEVNTAVDVAPLTAGFSSMPTIATLRLSDEGGQWRGDDESRWDIILAALECCDAVDVELASSILPKVAAAVKRLNKTLLVSRHNFSGVDSADDLDSDARCAFSAGADLYKIACLTKNEDDVAVLNSFLNKWKSEAIIVIGMGDSPAAQKTRRDFPGFGSRIAYAAVGEQSAPGQLSLAETAAAVRAGGKVAS